MLVRAAKCHTKLGNFKKASRYFELAMQIDDSGNNLSACHTCLNSGNRYNAAARVSGVKTCRRQDTEGRPPFTDSLLTELAAQLSGKRSSPFASNDPKFIRIRSSVCCLTSIAVKGALSFEEI